MFEAPAGEHAAARRALHETFLDQVRLDDLFDDVALLAERRRDRLEPDRTARIIFADAAQIAPVHRVEAALIDAEPQQRRICRCDADAGQLLDRRKVADPPQQTHRDPRGAACTARDFGRAVGPKVNGEDTGTASDNRREFARLVEHQAKGYAETLAQRPRDQARPRRRGDQRKGREVDADGAGRRSLADNQVELEILHRRIEDLLDRWRQAMDFVDKEDIARLQIGEQRGEIAAALDDRARGGTEPDSHLARNDVRECRLAEARRSGEEDMIERLAPGLRGIDKHAEIVPQLTLSDEFIQCQRPQRGLGIVLLGGNRIDDTRARPGHRTSSCNPSLIRAPGSASLPTSRTAAATSTKATLRRNPSLT